MIYTEGDMGLYYTYLSDGMKIEVCGYDDNEPTRYTGSLVYNNGTFESASFGGGRIVGTNNGANSEVHYFLTDHLGSTRVVAKVTSTGMVDLDRKDYYPFGKAWKQAGLPTSDNRYLFSGKERSNICLEDDYNSIVPLYDFGRRNYYPDGVFFLQQDPLLEKYYSIGQYNYCAGNPIKFMDLDGRKLFFASGVSESFKQKFSATVQYMNDRGSSGDLAALEASDQVYYIGETNSEGKTDTFSTDEQTIYWDPDTAYQTDEGIWLSPATVLAHEAGHAKKYDQNPAQFIVDIHTEDKQYKNKEERRNITTTEQQTAKKHKEIKGDGVTRKNHKVVNSRNVSDKNPYEIEDENKTHNDSISNL